MNNRGKLKSQGKLKTGCIGINMITCKRYWNKFNTVKSASKKAYYYVKFDESKSNLRHTLKVLTGIDTKMCISDKFNECMSKNT